MYTIFIYKVNDNSFLKLYFFSWIKLKYKNNKKYFVIFKYKNNKLFIIFIFKINNFRKCKKIKINNKFY